MYDNITGLKNKIRKIIPPTTYKHVLQPLLVYSDITNIIIKVTTDVFDRHPEHNFRIKRKEGL